MRSFILLPLALTGAAITTADRAAHVERCTSGEVVPAPAASAVPPAPVVTAPTPAAGTAPPAYGTPQAYTPPVPYSYSSVVPAPSPPAPAASGVPAAPPAPAAYTSLVPMGTGITPAASPVPASNATSHIHKPSRLPSPAAGTDKPTPSPLVPAQNDAAIARGFSVVAMVVLWVGGFMFL